MTPDCPLCGAPGAYIEHLSGEWRFCAGCARCYRLGADGRVTTSTDTNHAPQRKPVEQDVSGVAVHEP